MDADLISPSGSLSELQANRGRILRSNPLWAAHFLLWGTICATLAFSLATLVGVVSYFKGDLTEDRSQEQKPFNTQCFLDRPCESGHRFHPETVSELVSQTSSPEGKIFYSFAVIASICLIVSRYPMELRNVNMDTKYATPMIRAVVPPIGIMVVAQIPVVPYRQRITLGIKVSCSIHTVGAAAFVAGYLILEARTLWVLSNKLKGKERICRWIAVWGASISAMGFGLCGVLLSLGPRLGVCCMDEYEDTAVALAKLGMNTTDVQLWKRIVGEQVLWNTADEYIFYLKQCSFWAEMLAGIFIVMSHYFIWFFCEERHYEVKQYRDCED